MTLAWCRRGRLFWAVRSARGERLESARGDGGDARPLLDADADPQLGGVTSNTLYTLILNPAHIYCTEIPQEHVAIIRSLPAG